MGSSVSVNSGGMAAFFEASGKDPFQLLCRNEAPADNNILCDYEEKLCRVMVADERSRTLFAKYIKSGLWMRKFKASPEYNVILELAAQAQEDKKEDTIDLPLNDVQSEKDTFDASKPLSSGINDDMAKLETRTTLMDPESMRSAESNSSVTTIGGTGFTQHRDNLIPHSFTVKELLSLLFVSLYPHYLESSANRSMKFSGLRRMISSKGDDLFADAYGETGESGREGNGHALNLLLRAATYFDENNLVSMLATPHWMVNHLPSRMMDLAPISITVSSADADKGYPLLYVNRAFEKLSGYAAKEVLGRNLKLLQGPETDRAVCGEIREALEDQRAVRVEMVNYSKLGRKFRNLLVLTPVFDRMGIYSYVIGVQWDLSAGPLTHKDVQVIEDILALLPHILSC